MKSGLAFVLIATSNLLAFAVAWLSARLAFAVWRRVATNLFNNYIERPYEYFFRVHSSEVVKNVALETEPVQDPEPAIPSHGL